MWKIQWGFEPPPHLPSDYASDKQHYVLLICANWCFMRNNVDCVVIFATISVAVGFGRAGGIRQLNIRRAGWRVRRYPL